MSVKHPIIAATGSSGAGTSTVTDAFSKIFHKIGLTAAMIEGDAFHSYDRQTMQEESQKASIRGENFSHFGPAANHFERLEELFKGYSQSGQGKTRRYVRESEAFELGVRPGKFTDWAELPENTDLLFYEGLHGGVLTDHVNTGQYVDLLIGITPTINLEWNQKVWRDINERGYEGDAVQKNILRRMHDYVHYIVPQFSRTDINFQRVPMVDTSNPFAMQEIPTAGESMVVISFRDPQRFKVDFPYLLAILHGSFMSTTDTIVVPGSRMAMAIELICSPIIAELMAQRGWLKPPVIHS